MSKVAVYVRKSRSEETEEQINRQQSVLINLCERNKWDYDLYKEVGSSQAYDRPELQKMLDKVKMFEYEAVIASDFDRLSRRKLDQARIEETLRNYGCKFITPAREYDFNSKSDRLVAGVEGLMSVLEYDIIRERLSRGAMESARQGNWMGKKSPLGYKYNRETKRLDIVKKEAEIIQRIFKMYIDGYSTKEIAHLLTIEGYSEMVWSSAGISRILNNEVYIGVSCYGRTKQQKVDGKRQTISQDDYIRVENTHESIIDKVTWDKVQKIKLERNSRQIGIRLAKHAFSGLIVCKHCGNIHSFQNARGKQRISSCQTRFYKTGDQYEVCKNSGAYVDKFEQLFYEELSKYITEVDKYSDLIEEQDDSKELDIKKDQIKRMEQTIKRVQQGFTAGIFNEEESVNQIKDLKKQIKRVEKEIESIQSNSNGVDQVLERIKQFLQGKDDLSPRDKNEVLREVIDKIEYSNDGKNMKISIFYK